MKTKKTQFSFFGIFVLFLTVFLVLLLAPVQIGGKVGYVIVSGSSMEPNYYKGDLVLTRKTDSYEVGDITAYNNKILGGVVIHRIVDEVFDRYVLQGDNNDFLDRYQPVADEVIGKEWLHLPRWGLYIMQLREPGNFTFLVMLFVAMTLLPSGEDQGQEKKNKKGSNEPRRGGHMSNKEHTQDLIASLVVAGLIALVVLLISFSNPVTELVDETSSFEHQGHFTYEADSIMGVYDGTTANTGDPMFFNTSEKMQVNFDYDLHGYPLKNVSGTYLLSAWVRGQNGWTRTLEVVPETEFNELPLTFTGEVMFEEVVELISTFEGLTDTRADPYYLILVPTIRYSGDYRSKSVDFTFSPDLRFEVTEKSLELVFDNDETFNPSEVAVTTVEVEQSGTLNFLSMEIPVRTIRWVSVLVVILAAAGVTWLIIRQDKILKAGGSAAVKYEYGNLLASVSRKPLNKEMVLVDEMSDLISIATEIGSVVFVNKRGKYVFYYVQVGDKYYYYRIKESAVDDVANEPVSEPEISED